MTSINDIYINALLADATYALDDAVTDEYPKSKLIQKLEDRMTGTLAEYIGSNFTVVTHKDISDIIGSGFDATVWRDEAGKIYVSMTGSAPGADFITDADLTVTGVAGAQIVDMVNWWLKNTTAAGEVAKQIDRIVIPSPLVSPTFSFVEAVSTTGTGVLSTVTNVTVNGHSLGGHLTTVFSRLFGMQWPVYHSYTYNGAGFTVTSGLLLDQISAILGNGVGTEQFPTESQQSNIYAENGINVTTQNWFDGQHGQRIPLFNEEGTGIPNHLMYKLTDALALGNLIASIDSAFDIVQMSALFDAGSNQAEASLEKILDDLIEVFTGSVSNVPISDSEALRANFHEELSTLQASLFVNNQALDPQLKPEYQNLQIVSAGDLADHATANTPEGLAYRYALVELNPFAVVGLDQSASDALYKTAYNPNGELDWYHSATGQGTFSSAYLKDRAEMLQDNFNDSECSDAIAWSDRYYLDNSTGFGVGAHNAGKRIVFSDGRSESLAGSAGLDLMTGSGNEKVLAMLTG